MNFLCYAIEVYAVVCVVRVAMSWLNLDEGSSILASIGQISYAATEPLFATVRRRMPTFGDIPIDFSPMIVLIGLGVLRTVICSLA